MPGTSSLSRPVLLQAGAVLLAWLVLASAAHAQGFRPPGGTAGPLRKPADAGVTAPALPRPGSTPAVPQQADFIVAVGTGMLLTVSEAPAIDNLRSFPVALIPLVLVPLSALTHVAAFDLLRRGARP